MHTLRQKKPTAKHSGRRGLLFAVSASLAVLLTTQEPTARATWIQSTPITIAVDDQGTGEGVLFASSGNVYLIVSGLLPGFELPKPGRLRVTGDAYFLTNSMAIAGDYHLIEKTVALRSINGVFGQKYENERGIVIFLTGPSNDEPLDSEIETISIEVAQ